jgi:hypothetical protein
VIYVSQYLPHNEFSAIRLMWKLVTVAVCQVSGAEVTRVLPISNQLRSRGPKPDKCGASEETTISLSN